MYKSKEEQKEANRLASQRRRDKQKGMTQGMTKEGMTEQGMTQYPALLYALADPEKRAKLRRICESLSRHGQLRNVNYGCGGVPSDIVNEYLGVLT